ncbi:MAG: HD domain-containing phosphohydrolase [Bacillota bacterium]
MANDSRILIVDDELGPREALRMILRDDYQVAVAASGKEALDCFARTEYDLVILDIRMPDINGVDLLAEVKKKAPDTEVVMITAYASVETATKALRYGALDYLIKPFDRASVQNVVEKGLIRRDNNRFIKNKLKELQLANKTLEEEVEYAYKNIQSHYSETVSSLVAAVDAKDAYTKGHQERIAKLAQLIGQNVGFSAEELELIKQAAILHDIGKIGVPESILMKQDTLTDEEYAIIKKHPVIGAEILSPVQFLKEVVPLVLYHHERFDGKGYPQGLKGSQIPLSARVICITDAVDAMLSNRPYSHAKTVEKVKEELLRCSETHFDPQLVDVILKNELLAIYLLLVEKDRRQFPQYRG